MPKATIIAGLPGSGKSYYVRKKAKERGIKSFEDVRSPQNKALCYEKIANLLSKDEDVIFEDSAYSIPKRREEIKTYIEDRVPRAEIEWVFFEYDPVKCIENIIHDAQNGRKNSRSRVKTFFTIVPQFSIPDDCEPIPVTTNPEAKYLLFGPHD